MFNNKVLQDARVTQFFITKMKVVQTPIRPEVRHPVASPVLKQLSGFHFSLPPLEHLFFQDLLSISSAPSADAPLSRTLFHYGTLLQSPPSLKQSGWGMLEVS